MSPRSNHVSTGRDACYSWGGLHPSYSQLCGSHEGERGVSTFIKLGRKELAPFTGKKSLISNGLLVCLWGMWSAFTSSFAAASGDECVSSAGERDGSELQNLADCNRSITSSHWLIWLAWNESTSTEAELFRGPSNWIAGFDTLCDLNKWHSLLDFAAAAAIVTIVLGFPREIQSVLGRVPLFYIL